MEQRILPKVDAAIHVTIIDMGENIIRFQGWVLFLR